MALHIVWDEGLLEQTDAEVIVGSRRFFTPRKGLVTVLGPPCLIRAIAPKAVEQTQELAENLKTCYQEILYRSAQRGCESIRLPMLGGMVDGIPAYLELKIVAQCVREFNSWKKMEVYLIVDGIEPAQAVDMLMQLGDYLHRWYPEDIGMAPVAESGTPEKQTRPEVPQAREEALEAPEPPRLLEDPKEEWMNRQIRQWAADFDRACEDVPPAPDICSPAPDIFCGASTPSVEELNEIVREADAEFTETLLRFIQDSGKKDAQIYNKIGMSRQLFSKIRCNPRYKPTRETALAFAIALELDLEQTGVLIGSAGYCLGRSKADLIIRWFLERKNYDLVAINIALYEFDQRLLGF